jgi:hypothetical protein
MFMAKPPTGAFILAAWISWSGPAPCPAAPGDEPAPAPAVYGTWQTFTTADGLPHDRVLAVTALGNKVWVGTAGGLAHFEDGSWTSWTEQDGLPAPAISAVALDPRTGDVWLGTWGAGLVRFSGGRFDQFSQLNSGLAGDLVFAAVVAGGRVWAATNGGLSAYDVAGDTWELHLERRLDTGDTAITGLCVDGPRLYAAAWCEGLIRVVPEHAADRWSRLAAPALAETAGAALRADTTVDVAVAAGSLWWATQDSLLRRDATGRWSVRRRPDPGAGSGFVSCIGTADDGAVCLGTDRGLDELVDWPTGTWVTYGRLGAGPGGLITLRRDAEDLDVRVTSSSLPDDRVRCVTFQGADLWVGTAAGLARASGRQRLAGLPGRPADAATPTDTPESRHPDVIRIGMIMPRARSIDIPGTHPLGAPRGQGHVDPAAIILALEQANARGGYRGWIPFALGTGPEGWFRGWGWTTPEDDFPALQQQRDVAGMVAYVGPGARVTTAVMLRTEIPVVNCAVTPPTADERINPWIFRCRGDEPQRHQLLLEYLFEQLGCARLGIVRDAAAVAPAPVAWWRREAAARGQPIVADLRWEPENGQLETVLEALQDLEADVVLTWFDAPRSAEILRAMRRAGMSQVFVGSYGILNDEFAAAAGAKAGPVIAPCPPPAPSADHPAAASFVEDYVQRFKRSPRPEAYSIFEATTHLLEAIRIGGPDREAVRQALVDMSRDLEGEAHCLHGPLDPEQAVLGRLGNEGWQLCTLSELGWSDP